VLSVRGRLFLLRPLSTGLALLLILGWSGVAVFVLPQRFPSFLLGAAVRGQRSQAIPPSNMAVLLCARRYLDSPLPPLVCGGGCCLCCSTVAPRSCCTWAATPGLPLGEKFHMFRSGGGCCLCYSTVALRGCCTWTATPGLLSGRVYVLEPRFHALKCGWRASDPTCDGDTRGPEFSIYPRGVVFSPPSPIDQRPHFRDLLSNRYRTPYYHRSWYWDFFGGFGTRLGHLSRHSIGSIRIRTFFLSPISVSPAFYTTSDPIDFGFFTASLLLWLFSATLHVSPLRHLFH
jgi:hypothetical protein